jgi:hypothetical protein
MKDYIPIIQAISQLDNPLLSAFLITITLTLGFSDPLNCGAPSRWVRVQVLRVFTYNFVSDVVKKCVQHSCMFLEILLAFTFPLGKPDDVALDAWENGRTK